MEFGLVELPHSTYLLFGILKLKLLSSSLKHPNGDRPLQIGVHRSEMLFIFRQNLHSSTSATDKPGIYLMERIQFVVQLTGALLEDRLDGSFLFN